MRSAGKQKSDAVSGMRMMIVGTPSYFDARPNPTSPQDLLKHDCITLRLSSESL
jgi:hypothetical protein